MAHVEFTPEEWAALKGPKGDKGDSAPDLSARLAELEARIAKLEDAPAPEPEPDPEPEPEPEPEPVPAGEVPGLPILGIGMNGDAGPQDSAHLTRLRALTAGSMWYRRGFGFDGGNPTQAVKDVLGVLRAHGFKVLARISLGSNPSTVTAAQYAQHTRYVVQAAKDAGWSPDDIVFEYHNEYNGNTASAQHYVNMAKAAYPVIKSINPDYKVIGGSENVFKSGWQTWLDDIYRLGFGAVTDGLSWHNYAPRMAARTNEMRAILTRHGQQNKMVWLTEVGASTRTSGGSDGGFNSGDGGVSMQGQATRIVNNLQEIGHDFPWITHAILYVDLDRPNLPDAHEAQFGIYTNTTTWQRTPKPAVNAITALYRSN